MEEIYIIIFIMLILIIYLLYKVHDHEPMGGCKGTIYGCCPDNITAKRNSLGTNC